MAHPLGMLGLIVNVAGTFLLLRFPPAVVQYTQDGRRVVEWVGTPTAEGKHRALLAMRGYPLGVSLLTLGFLLQLLDLLRT
jgi:hypothetical protein